MEMLCQCTEFSGEKKIMIFLVLFLLGNLHQVPSASLLQWLWRFQQPQSDNWSPNYSIWWKIQWNSRQKMWLLLHIFLVSHQIKRKRTMLLMFLVQSQRSSFTVDICHIYLFMQFKKTTGQSDSILLSLLSFVFLASIYSYFCLFFSPSISRSPLICFLSPPSNYFLPQPLPSPKNGLDEKWF